MAKKVPWEFQTAGATALWNFVHEQPSLRPVVVMPTGTGKSMTMALFVMGIKQTYPHVRILNFAHVKELVKGNHDELLEMWPAAPAGIISSGLGRRDTMADIVYAGIGTYQNISIKRAFDFIIIDEAHRVSDDEKTGYQKVITREKAKNPNLVVIGFTATDFRQGSGRLSESGIFDAICFDLSSGPAFVWLVDNHYLIRLRSVKTAFSLDESGISVRGGEYVESEASQAFRDQDILERAVDDIIQRGQNRRAWLGFAQSIDDAELLVDMFKYKGYVVEAVHSKRGDRDDVLAKFERGEYRGVINQNVLTTGYDNRNIDLLFFLRLTRVASLWVQMLGRGTRPAWVKGFDLSTFEGRRDSILASHKQDCLVLDYARNIDRLGPINYPRIPKRRTKGGGEAPVRTCPVCETDNHISLKFCEECGHEFVVESKIIPQASDAEVVLDLNNLPPPPPVEFGIFRPTKMISATHKAKAGKPPTVRVDYFCGVRRFSVWLCPEHVGFARKKTEDWWKWHGGNVTGPCPATVAELVAAVSKLQMPEHIKVWVNTKYPEIVAYDFIGNKFEMPPELGGRDLETIRAETAAADKAAESQTAQIQAVKDSIYADMGFDE